MADHAAGRWSAILPTSTRDQLATAVVMSRAAFAARFTTLVGEPPLTYLTRWRMEQSATLLQQDDRSLAQVAAQVGYGSEAAFSKAFKQQFGLSPRAFRQLGCRAATQLLRKGTFE